MREILFRGKRVDNGEWVEGYYFQEIGHFIKELPGSVAAQSWLVDPDTVGQYVGITDKNGKRAFDGDIIKVVFVADSDCPECWDELSTIVYDDTHHAWFTRLMDGELGAWMYEYDNVFEVVGNIHDEARP